MLRVLVSISFLSITVVAVSGTASPVHFSDEFARTKVVPLCAATELVNPQTCLNLTFPDATVIRKITVRCDGISTNTCSGYSAISHADKAIMLVFRGTVGELQFLAEFSVTVFGKKAHWIAGGSVSKYFHDAFFAIWNGGLKDDYLTLANNYKDYELWVVGHSLGGAIASLAASFIEKMKLLDGNRIKLVTFGQPRTGDVDFAKAHGAQIPYSFRVTHAHDLVPHFPLEGFRHYKHHKSEIYYNNNMTTADYVECDDGESKKCSDGKINASFNDHHRYFNVFISRWGAVGCTGDPVNPPYRRL